MRSHTSWASAAFALLPVLLVLAAPASAQNPRESVQIDSPLTGQANAPSVGTDGDLSAVAFIDEAGPSVQAVLSDGRGIAWGSVLQIDSDLSGAAKSLRSDSCAVVDGRVYVSWLDQRDGSGATDELYFSLHDGAAFQGDQRIDHGMTVGVADVEEFRMAVDPMNADDPGDDRIHLLMRIDPGLGIDELWVVSSVDGGVSFGPAVAVTTINGSADIDDIALAAEDGVVHVAWRDNRVNLSDDDVWYQQSLDGGLTWMPADTQLDLSGGDADDEVEIAVDGSTVSVVWQQDLPTGGPEELHANVSTNGGAIWTGDMLLGDYIPGVDDVGDPSVAVNGDRVIVTWRDDRSGIDLNYLTDSTNGGVSWSADTLLTTDTAGRVKIAGSGSSMALSWIHDVHMRVEARSSRDGGATWGSSFTVSTTSGDADAGELAFNETYGNFVHTWVSDDTTVDHLYAGGFRPQSLAGNGSFTVGSSVSWSVSNWPAVEAGMRFGVLVSGGTGSFPLPFGDDRETGLRSDSVLAQSTAEIPGLLSGSIGATGTGSTMSFPLPNAASGLDLHCVAVAFDTAGGVSFGSITDVLVIPVP